MPTKAITTVRAGYELNYALRAIQVRNHTGTLPPVDSFLGLSSDNVVLTAMKRAEQTGDDKDSDGVILRFYEWAGNTGDVTLQLPPGTQSAWETNLIEQPIVELPVVKGSVTVHTGPYEIKTLKVRVASDSRP